MRVQYDHVHSAFGYLIAPFSLLRKTSCCRSHPDKSIYRSQVQKGRINEKRFWTMMKHLVKTKNLPPNVLRFRRASRRQDYRDKVDFWIDVDRGASQISIPVDVKSSWYGKLRTLNKRLKLPKKYGEIYIIVMDEYVTLEVLGNLIANIIRQQFAKDGELMV